MGRQVVEITQIKQHVSIDRGFLIISYHGKEIGKIPLDLIDALILHSNGPSCSVKMLHRMAEKKIPVVICDGKTHSPSGVLLPIEGHHRQGAVMDAQLTATQPLRKQLWKKIIVSKILQQASLVAAVGENSAHLEKLAMQVNSGDTKNCEAQAAKIYFPLVFGVNFRRGRDLGGLNSLLNYGYMVLRAGILRQIVAAGLHPTIGLFHHNKLNAMRLADDLMEPFRPFVDWTVRKLSDSGLEDITPKAKAILVQIWQQSIPMRLGATQGQACLEVLAKSLAKIYLKERSALELPKKLTPNQWKNFINVEQV